MLRQVNAFRLAIEDRSSTPVLVMSRVFKAGRLASRERSVRVE